MSTPSQPHPPPRDRGHPGVGLSPVRFPSPTHADSAAGLAAVSPRLLEPGSAEHERHRLNLALEAINGLAGCLDQLIRELRRGVGAAQWRVVQEEVMRIRRLLTTRPEIKEGPPRDEGPASQPPPEPTPPGPNPTSPGPGAPPAPRPGS